MYPQGVALMGVACPFGPIVSEGGQKQQWQSTNDAGVGVFRQIFQVNFSRGDQDTHDVATLFVAFGGLGFRSVERTNIPAKWANQADCMPVRHLDVVERFAVFLESHAPYVSEGTAAARSFRGIMGFKPPWGRRERGGWQHEAVHESKDISVMPRCFHKWRLPAKPPHSGGFGAGLSFTCCPTSPVTTFSFGQGSLFGALWVVAV